MHVESIKHLINENDIKELGDLLICAIDRMKAIDEDAYIAMEKKVYKAAYGNHMCDEMLKKAYKLFNPKWTVEQTTSVARSMNVTFDSYNSYDFNYAMNYLYYTLSNSLNTNEPSSYGRMAKVWLEKNSPIKHYYYIADMK